jgi:hypothetical protein
MTEEAELRRAIIGDDGLCRRLGLDWHYCNDSRLCQGRRGFPDLVIAGRTRVLVWELKAELGIVTPDQVLWLMALGGEVRRPSDLRSGRIERELTALRDE